MSGKEDDSDNSKLGLCGEAEVQCVCTMRTFLRSRLRQLSVTTERATRDLLVAMRPLEGGNENESTTE